MPSASIQARTAVRIGVLSTPPQSVMTPRNSPPLSTPVILLVFRSFGVGVARGRERRKHRRCLYPPLVRRSADASWADLTGLAGRVAVVVAAGVPGAVVSHVLRAGGGA